MNTNLDLKNLVILLKRLLKGFKRYSLFLFIMVVLGVYGFLVYQIGNLSGAEPSQEVLTEELKVSKRLKVDQQAIDKIQQLEDQNVSVQALFKAARDNPFSDD
jgi:hypothetical protein